jgi:hypothetical protein
MIRQLISILRQLYLQVKVFASFEYIANKGTI